MKGKNNDTDEGRQITVSIGSRINHSALLENLHIFTMQYPNNNNNTKTTYLSET